MIAAQAEEFHAFLVYAWHFAKCPGMKERSNHSHALVSYDRAWMTRTHRRICNGTFYGQTTDALSTGELEQILLENEAAHLMQKRKSLEPTALFHS